MQLNYYSCGSGFSLIVLHGLLGSSDNWQTLSRKFGEHFTVYALDLRNHGASPHSDTFDYPSMAEDLREFMELHGIAEAHLLGHSMGGKTVMQFASVYPDRVRKLIVADIGIKGYPPHHTQILQALWDLQPERYSNRAEMDQALAARLPEPPLRAFLLKSVGRDENGRYAWKINLPAIRDKYPNIIGPLRLAKLFNKPALFIRGANSDYIVPGDEPAIREHFPAAEFVTLEGAGHWLHAEKPQEFFTAAMKFLAA